MNDPVDRHTPSAEVTPAAVKTEDLDELGEAVVPEVLSVSHLSRAQVQFQGAAKRLEVALAEHLQVESETRIKPPDQTTIESVLQRVVAGSHLVSTPAGDGSSAALIEFSPTFLSTALEILLGGSPAVQTSQRPEVTDIDLHVLTGTIHAVVDAFSSLSSGPPRPVTTRNQPIAAGSSVLFLNIDVHLGGVRTHIGLTIPTFVFRLAADEQLELTLNTPAPPASGRNLPEVLKSAEITFEVVLPPSKITIRNVLALKEGQVLMPAQTQSGNAHGLINGVPKLRGEIVSAASRIALRVDELM